MKTLLATLLLATTLFANASGTKEKSVASYRLTKSFNAQFGAVDNVVWRNAANNMVKAEFEMDEEKICAYFDRNGDFVAQTKEIKPDQLPKNLQAALREKAPGAEILNVFEMISDEERAWFVETTANNEHKLWKGNSFGKLSRYFIK